MPHTEPDDAFYRTLLESTQAIPWQIDWATASFSYIGPQIEPLLGWSPDSWRTVQDWSDRMHPEDRERVVSYCVAQSQAGVDHEADYRALTPTGELVWIRDVVHVVRGEDGQVQTLVGFMFDITERKQAEQQLLQMQQELKDLSYRDGLTGLNNRRHFDAALEREWQAARRDVSPLSLLMVDVDFFKAYNDHYGHVEGDACLKTVAQALTDSVHRPRDVVARFGGEEFVVLLPATDAHAARAVAERIRQAVAAACIPHSASSVDGRVTVSVGTGTLVPGENDDLLAFLQDVDRSLYRAKREGRNRVVQAGSY